MPEWIRALVASPCFVPCGILLVIVIGGLAYVYATGGKIRFWINRDDDES